MFLQTTCSVTNFKALFVLFSFCCCCCCFCTECLNCFLVKEWKTPARLDTAACTWNYMQQLLFFVVDLQQPCFSYTWSGCRSMFGRMDGWMDGCLVGILQLEGCKLFCFEGNVSWQATTPWVLDLLRFFVVETNDLRSDDGLHVCCFFSLFWLIINSKKPSNNFGKLKTNGNRSIILVVLKQMDTVLPVPTTSDAGTDAADVGIG